MGLAFSAFSKFGLTGLGSLTTGQVYDRHFKERSTGKFEDFHIAYVDFCKFFNTIMPGQDFETPPKEKLEEFFLKWDKELDKDKKKDMFIEFMEKNVKEATVDDSIFIMAGVVAPAAAMLAKKSSESIPQVKKFKLHIIPNVVFVPLCTLGAIMGATALQVSRKSKANPVEENKASTDT